MGAKVREKGGAYWVVVHHKGRRKWKKIGTDKRAAQKVARDVNAKLARAAFSIETETAPQTVEVALHQWYADYRPTFSDSYAQLAEINIRLHLVPFFGSMSLAAFEEQDLLRFITAKTTGAQKPLKASTLTNILSVLRRVMSLAVERGELKRNPCQHIGRLLRKVERQQADEIDHVQAWSREEVAQLLATARTEEPRFYPLMTFLLSTGCRRGEALGLKWEDVNLDERRILIRRALVRGKLGTPKSSRARFVVLSPVLGEVLRDLLSERQRAALKGQWKETPEFVFCSETGGVLDERNVSRSWDRLRRKAQKHGVRPLRLHCARHTFATLALASRKSVPWVAAQLGHANPETTLRVYAHALREEETDLSFLDFGTNTGGTGRHPRGTKAVATAGTKQPPRLTKRGGFGILERETGIEPATLSLGREDEPERDFRRLWRGRARPARRLRFRPLRRSRTPLRTTDRCEPGHRWDSCYRRPSSILNGPGPPGSGAFPGKRPNPATQAPSSVQRTARSRARGESARPPLVYPARQHLPRSRQPGRVSIELIDAWNIA